MIAAVVVSPLLGAAAVNGLCGALVLNNVPCPTCEGEGGAAGNAVTGFTSPSWYSCFSCAGSGFVAPSVTPGQHLAVITTRTELTFEQFCVLGAAGYVDETGRPTIDVHLGSVIGSVTATTPALPIVRNQDEPPAGWTGGVLAVEQYAPTDPVSLIYWPREDSPHWEVDDLSEWLPWLGDDLVGRWAVLIDNPHVIHDCPRNGESVTLCCGKSPFELPSTDRMTVDGFVTCGRLPVPLPDGVDLTEGTIVEVDL